VLITVLWVLSSVVVGWLGRNRAAGFLGFFVASIFLSPVATLVALILTAPSGVIGGQPSLPEKRRQ
jgi:hypothetical protein